MAESSPHIHESEFRIRVDAGLKAAFQAATEAEHRPAAQVVREFMLTYVKRRERRNFQADAHRQSLELAKAALDPHGDESQVMREIEAELSDPAYWPED